MLPRILSARFAVPRTLPQSMAAASGEHPLHSTSRRITRSMRHAVVGMSAMSCSTARRTSPASASSTPASRGQKRQRPEDGAALTKAPQIALSPIDASSLEVRYCIIASFFAHWSAEQVLSDFSVQMPPPQWLLDRKGGSTLKSVDPLALKYLNAGLIESKNLMEGLSIDCAQLLHAVFAVPLEKCAHLNELKTAGKSAAVVTLLDEWAPQWLDSACTHPSDTVRGWACYGVSARAASFADALQALQPLADDTNSGVREWAWMAARRWVLADPAGAIAHLEERWSTHTSANLRRFCAEVTRPRGVWCAHIPSLKADPSPLGGLLGSLCSAPERYVQNAVANNMNDCSKTAPAWVRSTTQQWLQRYSNDEGVAYVVARSRRTLSKRS